MATLTEYRLYCLGRGLHEETILGYFALEDGGVRPVGWAAMADRRTDEGHWTSLPGPLSQRTAEDGTTILVVACRLCHESRWVREDALAEQLDALGATSRRSLYLSSFGQPGEPD